ncbi:MAG: rhomboid family intramembrane serine protease [Phycisphaera sp.]|nr:MAG: rhomboid family intramembrane serine protease [Phycisphaera sp.]
MLIPLGTDRPLRRTPVVTYALLALNVVAYMVQSALTKDPLSPVAAIVWNAVLVPGVSGWWTWVTYAFLHGSPLHLLGNMVFLWVFAQAVEDRFGRIGFSAFYLVGAVATGGAHALFSEHAVVGASGAVACCTGAYLVMFPRANVRVLLLLFVGVTLWPAWVFIALAISWDVLTWARGGMGVAVWAHFGGYAYGFAIAFTLLAFRVVPREPYDLFMVINQKRRRNQIRSAVRSAGLDQPMAAKPPRREKPPSPADAAAELRRGIENALKDRRPGSAATMYRRLIENHENAESRLSRDVQLDLANTLYQRKQHELAARAYEGFLKAEGDDDEAPMVRVLLARVLADHLDDAGRAKDLLRQALLELRDPQLRELAQADLDAL